jgi:hypothetical protein
LTIKDNVLTVNKIKEHLVFHVEGIHDDKALEATFDIVLVVLD